MPGSPEAGISVSVGLMGPEAARDQRGHVTRILQGPTAVFFLKLARTADGICGGRERAG